jgi:hypothetical protein
MSRTDLVPYPEGVADRPAVGIVGDAGEAEAVAVIEDAPGIAHWSRRRAQAAIGQGRSTMRFRRGSAETRQREQDNRQDKSEAAHDIPLPALGATKSGL